MAEKQKPDVLILFTRFFDLSVSRNPLSKSKIMKFVNIIALFFNYESTCELTGASVYDIKTAA